MHTVCTENDSVFRSVKVQVHLKKKVQNNPVPHFLCCNYALLKSSLIKAHISRVEGFLTVQNFRGKLGKRIIIPDIQTV